MAAPTWAYCPMPGAAMTATLRTDENAYTDGYTERRVRGINPVRHQWSLQFPFVTAEEYRTMDGFLRANLVDGFWYAPPTGQTAMLVTCDEWSSNLALRRPGGEMMGTLSATFVRSFAPQNLIDQDASNWKNAVNANGGPVSTARLKLVNDFIAAEKRDGTWTRTDDYWMLWGENEKQALTSLKQHRLATAVAAPVFTLDRGYAFDGVTQYLDTGFIPDTHSLAMTYRNLRLASYEQDGVAGPTVNCGIDQGAVALWLCPVNVTATLVRANAPSNVSYSLPSGSDGRGLMSVSLNGVSIISHRNYLNGISLPLADGPAEMSEGRPTAALYIGGANQAGALAYPRACSIGFVAVGAALSAVQEAAQYNNVQALAAAVGAQV